MYINKPYVGGDCMTLIVLLAAPTLLIFLGLQVMNSVPITFLLFYGWLFAVPFVDLMLVKRFTFSQTLRQLGFGLQRKSIVVGLVSGAIYFLAILLAGSLFLPLLFEKAELERLLVEWKFSGELFWWLVLVLVLVNPFLEELYWRGYFFYKANGRFAQKKLILLSSFFYSLYHLLSVVPLFAWPTPIIVIIAVFVAGVSWGILRAKTGSLAGAVVSHIFADAGIILLYLLYLRS